MCADKEQKRVKEEEEPRNKNTARMRVIKKDKNESIIDKSGDLFHIEGTTEQIKELLSMPQVAESYLLAQIYAAGGQLTLDNALALLNLRAATPSPLPEAPSTRPKSSFASPEQVDSSVDKADESEQQPMEVKAKELEQQPEEVEAKEPEQQPEEVEAEKPKPKLSPEPKVQEAIILDKVERSKVNTELPVETSSRPKSSRREKQPPSPAKPSSSSLQSRKKTPSTCFHPNARVTVDYVDCTYTTIDGKLTTSRVEFDPKSKDPSRTFSVKEFESMVNFPSIKLYNRTYYFCPCCSPEKKPNFLDTAVFPPKFEPGNYVELYYMFQDTTHMKRHLSTHFLLQCLVPGCKPGYIFTNHRGLRDHNTKFHGKRYKLKEGSRSTKAQQEADQEEPAPKPQRSVNLTLHTSVDLFTESQMQEADEPREPEDEVTVVIPRRKVPTRKRS